jgi:hypothetical protein
MKQHKKAVVASKEKVPATRDIKIEDFTFCVTLLEAKEKL